MSRERPNVLLILDDQQRGDCLGLEGHPVLQTPNMDYIGASGTWFRHAYAECPQCIPARRTIMSGQAPATHGMLQNTPSTDWDPPATLAGELRAAGYQTHLSGKLHLAPKRKRYGFDAMELADSTRGEANDFLDWLHGETPPQRWAMAHGATPNGWIGRPSHLPEEQTHTFWCVSRAIEFLERRDRSAPFFLNVSFIDPHPPFTPPTWLFKRYDEMDLPEPDIGAWVDPVDAPTRGIDIEMVESRSRDLELDPHVMHACRAGYFGLINHVDMQMGRLLQYLRDQRDEGERLIDTTLIVFASDHGEMLGDHRRFHKSWPYEASVRIPFLVRSPSALGNPREVEVDAPVGLQDLMPTILDAVGLPVPEAVTGKSLMPFIRGETPAWRDVLHGEHAGGRNRPETGMHFLTDGRWKYIWYTQTGREHLFDLDADANELHDLADSSDLGPWRARLARELQGRPEGFTDGSRLVVGRPHAALVPGTGRTGAPPIAAADNRP